MGTEHGLVLESDHRAANAINRLNAGETGVAGGGPETAIRFRRFHAMPGGRLLLRDGRPVELGSRAFDLLIVLLKSRGALVTKGEIVNHVWPSTSVEESNLRFQMASLRRALGKDRDVIKTIPGRGYLFAAEVASVSVDTRSTVAALAASEGMSAPAERARQSIERFSDSPREMETSTVVIIDDDPNTREAIQGLLRSAGLRVESFASVQAFLDSSRSSPPACLVLDALMPGQSGLDFQAVLARADAPPPVIFISGHADVHMTVRAMKAGAFDFFTKPVRHQELLDAVQRAMASELGKAANSRALELR